MGEIKEFRAGQNQNYKHSLSEKGTLRIRIGKIDEARKLTPDYLPVGRREERSSTAGGWRAQI